MKIEVIIDEYHDSTDFPVNEPSFENLLKKYAKWYAKQCLVIAAENAYFETDGHCNQPEIWVVKESITNIKLPPHD